MTNLESGSDITGCDLRHWVLSLSKPGQAKFGFCDEIQDNWMQMSGGRGSLLVVSLLSRSGKMSSSCASEEVLTEAPGSCLAKGGN